MRDILFSWVLVIISLVIAMAAEHRDEAVIALFVFLLAVSTSVFREWS